MFRKINLLCDRFKFNRIPSPRRPIKVKNTSNDYWVQEVSAQKREIKQLRQELTIKSKKVEEIRRKKEVKVAEIEKLNVTLKELIRVLEVSDPFERIDGVFEEIYRKQFDISVCEFLTKDLIERRTELSKMKEIELLNFVKIKHRIRVMEEIPNNKENWSKTLKKINLKSKDYEEWIQNVPMKPQSVQSVNLNQPENPVELFPIETFLTKKCAEIKRELFILKYRDLNIYERITEISDQIKVYTHFMTDLRLETGNNKLKWKHFYKQSERIKRLKKLYNEEYLNNISVESWNNWNILYTVKEDENKYSKLMQKTQKQFQAKYKKISETSHPEELILFQSKKSKTDTPNLNEIIANYRKYINSYEGADEVSSDIKMYHDSMIFSTAAKYDELLNEQENNKKTMCKVNSFFGW